MLNAVELYLLNLALHEATSPEAKALAIGELKRLEAYTSNLAFKAMLHALEDFLAVVPAA